MRFNKAGFYAQDELRPDEFAYMAIKEDGFEIGNTRYSIFHNPGEQFIVTYYSEEHGEETYCTALNLEELVAQLVLFFKVCNYE